VPGLNLRCNGCKNQFKPSIGYFRCDSETCDYDLCARCGILNQNLVTDGSLCCPENHPVQLYAPGATKQRRRGNGSLYTSAGSSLICNGCRQHFQTADLGGYFSCAQTCDFDLCPKCARCNNGHTFQVQIGNPYAISHRVEYFCCDHCGRMVHAPEMDLGFARCAAC